MNRDKLKEANARFLAEYPGGFSHPAMLEIVKKHRVEKMNKLAQDSFGREQFNNPEKIVDAMVKVVSQSSMVSVFEKPKFRDLAKGMIPSEKERMAMGLREFLHGDQAAGFDLMLDLLAEYKLAKWPLLTICPVYYRPDVEVFIKPTTVKEVIRYFELDGLKYSPKPSYSFYKAYREEINRMKKESGLSLNDNAAFCGFLFMAVRGGAE